LLPAVATLVPAGAFADHKPLASDRGPAQSCRTLAQSQKECEGMSIFNDLLGALGGAAPADIENLASKVGLSPELAEQAIAALGAAHQEPGDTVEGASQATGIDPSILGQIVTHIGGEGSLGQFAQMMADNPQAQGLLGSIAGRFFGKG
jgi:hypothetical protein